MLTPSRALCCLTTIALAACLALVSPSASASIAPRETGPSTLSISATPKVAPGGSSVTVTVNVDPVRPDRVITLWQKGSGAWTQVASYQMTAATGTLAWAAPNKSGIYQLRMTSAAGADYTAAQSAAVKIKVKAVAQSKWVSAVAAVPAHLNQGDLYPPEVVALASDVTVTFGGQPAPRSVTLTYGPDCVARAVASEYEIASLDEYCQTLIYLNPGSQGFSRFRGTIAVTAGGTSVKVTITTGQDTSVGPRLVTPGRPWVVDMKMDWTGISFMYAPDTTTTSGATVSILTPEFGR